MSAEYNDEHNHFPIAAAVAYLGEIAKKHDVEGLIRASGLADAAPTDLLRGVSFLGECLETYEDAPPMQARLARGAIQEITALCAALNDINSNASRYLMMKDLQGGAA